MNSQELEKFNKPFIERLQKIHKNIVGLDIYGVVFRETVDTFNDCYEKDIDIFLELEEKEQIKSILNEYKSELETKF